MKNIHECDILDGFVPINEMIKSHSRHQMASLWKQLTTAGCEVIGFKTDAIYFIENAKLNIQKRLNVLSIQENDLSLLGKGKYMKDDLMSYPRLKYTTKVTDKSLIKINNNSHEISNYTIHDICEPIVPNTIIIADAGCGKTYTLIQYLINKYLQKQILVVTAWNAQAYRIKNTFNVDAITWHHLRGAKIDDTIRVGVKGYE